jgi:hypothetical protein
MPSAIENSQKEIVGDVSPHSAPTGFRAKLIHGRGEYEAAGAGIGAAWRETLGRNFPPSTLLYIGGLVDARAKVEIEVTAFVPAA